MCILHQDLASARRSESTGDPRPPVTVEKTPESLSGRTVKTELVKNQGR
jgi:hypothetical protein